MKEQGTWYDYQNAVTNCSSRGKGTVAYELGSKHHDEGCKPFNEREFDEWSSLPEEKHPATSSGAQREKMNVTPYDLVPFQEMTDAYVRVAEFGAKKYAPWNWSKGLARVQIIGSLLRHVFSYLRGEECDPDSGLSHTDHILWNAAALSHNVHHNLEDGRRVEPDRDYKNDK